MRKASKYLALFIFIKTSLEKVLKVVKPPNRPTFMNLARLGLTEFIFCPSEIRIKEPKKFTKRVAGHDWVKNFFTMIVIKYLRVPPRPLPKNTSIKTPPSLDHVWLFLFLDHLN